MQFFQYSVIFVVLLSTELYALLEMLLTVEATQRELTQFAIRVIGSYQVNRHLRYETDGIQSDVSVYTLLYLLLWVHVICPASKGSLY